MNDVLADSPARVQAAVAKIASGELVPDGDAEAVVDALAARCSPATTSKATS